MVEDDDIPADPELQGWIDKFVSAMVAADPDCYVADDGFGYVVIDGRFDMRKVKTVIAVIEFFLK